MAENDFSFEFDTASFQKAMLVLNSGFNNLFQQSQQMNAAMQTIAGKMTSTTAKFSTEMTSQAKKMDKEGGSSVMSFVKKLGVVLIGIFAIRKAWGMLAQYIPELNTTVKIAGDIIGKNLLYPLRQFLLPYLQRFLDWTRQHRTMFLQWGQVIVNAFKAVIAVGKALWDVLKSVMKIINDATGGAFSRIASNIEEVFNILIFKATALSLYIVAALKPILEILAKITVAFGSGFAEGFKNTFSMAEAIGKLSGAFKKLGDAWDKIKPTEGQLLSFFRKFGEAMGSLEGLVLTHIVDQVVALVDSLTALFNLIDRWKKGDVKMEDVGSFFKDWGKNMVEGSIFGKSFSLLKKGYGALTGEKVDDAVITKDGKVIRTNPEDTITASKDPAVSPAGMQRKSIRISLDGLNITSMINVTEGNARAAGESFGAGLGSRIYNELMHEMTAEGALAN